MSKFILEIDGKVKSTTKGNVDEYYGGGEEAYASIAAARLGVPLAIRPGKTVGILEANKIVEYIWHNDNVTDSGLILKSPESSNSLSINDPKVLATSEVSKILNDKIVAIETLLSSDDTALDELQELVDFIKINKQDLDNLAVNNISGLVDALALKVNLADYTPAHAIVTNNIASNLTAITANLQSIGIINTELLRLESAKVNKADIPSIQDLIPQANVDMLNLAWGWDMPGRLVDGNTYTAISTTLGVDIRLTMNTRVTKYSLYRDSTSLAYITQYTSYTWSDQRVITGWVLEGSNDNTNWVELDNITNFDFTLDTEHVFSIINPNVYVSYRLIPNQTKEGTGSTKYFLLSEIKTWSQPTITESIDSKLDKFIGTKNPLLLLNQTEDWVLPPQIITNNVYVDRTLLNSDLSTLDNRSTPYHSLDAATTAIKAKLTADNVTELNGRYVYYKIICIGRTTFTLLDLPKCNVEIICETGGSTIDMSAKTNMFYGAETSFHAYYIINFNNPNGTIKWHKNFSGSGLQSRSSDLIINANTCDFRSLVDSNSNLFWVNTVNGYVGNFTQGQGYSFYTQKYGGTNASSRTNFEINSLSFDSVSTSVKRVFQNCYGDSSRPATFKVNRAVGTNNSSLAMFSSCKVYLGDVFNISVGNLTSSTPVNFTGGVVFESLVFYPNTKYSGYISDFAVAAGFGDNPTNMSFIDFTIGKLRWSDDDLTRVGTLIANGYSGNEITLSNFVILESYLTFVALKVNSVAVWGAATEQPMNWFGTVAVKMMNDNPAFIPQNTTAGNTTRINHYGNLRLNEGTEVASNIEITPQNELGLKYKSVGASRDLTNADRNKTLVITATGVVLTIPATGLHSDFNVAITTTAGNNGSIAYASGVTVDQTSLTIASQEMKSIGKMNSTYIIRP